jgi:hypothetical protein
MLKGKIAMSIVACGLATAAYAQAPPINYDSGFNGSGGFHVGTAACQVLVDDPAGGTERVWVGASPLQRPNALAQCTSLNLLNILGRPFRFSLSGGTVPCSPFVCGAKATALEIGDIVP